jgi:hypothetical protein
MSCLLNPAIVPPVITRNPYYSRIYKRELDRLNDAAVFEFDSAKRRELLIA